MRKLDQLFIRACKSKDPSTRVISVYRRFYLRGIHNEKPEPHIVVILAKICDAFCPFTTVGIMQKLSPSNGWEYSDVDFNSLCMKILISKIRFTDAVKFPGLTKPAFFRTKVAA